MQVPGSPASDGEDALRRNEQRYRNLVEVSPDAILLNSGGRVALVNPACARLFGARDPSEMVGRVALDLFHPDYHDTIRQRISDIVVGRSAPLLEEKIIRLDGEVRDVEVVAVSFPDGDGVGIQVILRDITERKRAEVALVESEQRARARAAELQTVLDTVPAAVWIARDPQGSLIEANRFGARLLRRPQGTNVSVTAPTGERPMNFRPMKEGKEIPGDELPIQAAARFGREFHDYEFDLEFDDGVVRHLLGDAAPIRGDDGRPKGSVGAFIDITERKQAEARAESLARFPRENPDPVIRLAADLTVLYANAAASRLLGELDVKVGQGAPRELAEPALRARSTSKRIKVEVETGGVVFQLSVVPVGSEVNLYAQDVTARKVAEDALRLEARRKTEFLAVLSHELRNPLASLRISIDLLDRAPAGSDMARRASEILHRQAEHLSRLVDDLLDVSRITHGKVELRRTRIDAREVVRRVCDDVRDAFEDRDIELFFSEPAHPVWVDADAARLVQMVGNLLNNALKFSQPGGEVHVSTRKRGIACEVNVRDNGIGIEPHDLDSIFDPFVQAERTRHGARGGLGIGLALVRELAVGHGGWVRAHSAGPGQGAEFVLMLPLAVAAQDEASAPEAVKPGKPASGLSILVIEDNEDARESLGLLLKLNGHAVTAAATGRAGLEAAASHPPDVIVCDIGLPDQDGFDVVRGIRAAHPKAHVFAIALSGYAQPDDREQALAAGFDAHLAKPLRFEQLDGMLGEVARKRGG
ncbi:MAG TPA: PAS domain S-box protein [Anaeromyxobacteraceae bacterium]|nr:PAS domain S-box protein [Anaeromyxobacteraceae bacterium]